MGLVDKDKVLGTEWLPTKEDMSDVTLEDVPMYVGVSSSLVVSRRTGIGMINGRINSFSLMVYLPVELFLAWTVALCAAALPVVSWM